MNTGSFKLGSVQIAIILLTLATAGVHISLLFSDVMFTLNGLGYLSLLVAYFLPMPLFKKNHNLVRWVYMGFTLVTILAWVWMGDKSWPGGALGYITKTIEVLLLGMLWTDRRS